MTTVRTTTSSTGETWYNAKDIFEAIGKSYHGHRSLAKLSSKQVSQAHEIAGNKAKRKHYMLTDKGVASLCRSRKVANPISTVSFQAKETEKLAPKLEELTSTVNALKQLIAGMLAKDIKPSTAINPVDSKPITSKLKNGSEIRAALRERCITYAKQLAESHNITDTRDIGIFYDLTYNLLYTKFKQKTGFDIKKVAHEQGTTGLKVALDFGLIDDLYTCAKETLEIK